MADVAVIRTKAYGLGDFRDNLLKNQTAEPPIISSNPQAAKTLT